MRDKQHCDVEPLSEQEIEVIERYFQEYGSKINSKTKVLSVYKGKDKKVTAISEDDTLRRREKKI